MSGGSFNYLCFADTVADLAEREEQLRRMAEEIEALSPGHPAAEASRQLLALAGRAVPADLQRVWRAIEWWRSADKSEEDARLALAEYPQGGSDAAEDDASTTTVWLVWRDRGERYGGSTLTAVCADLPAAGQVLDEQKGWLERYHGPAWWRGWRSEGPLEAVSGYGERVWAEAQEVRR